MIPRWSFPVFWFDISPRNVLQAGRGGEGTVERDEERCLRGKWVFARELEINDEKKL